MATENSWECPSCGYKNDSFATECRICGQAKPRSADSSNSSGRSTGGKTTGANREHLTVAHFIVMVVLIVGIFAFSKSPVGSDYLDNIHLGLVMDFSSTSAEELGEKWSGFGSLLLIGGGLIGLSGGLVGAALGALLGLLAFAAICFVCSFFLNYIIPFFINTGAYTILGVLSVAVALGCAVAIVNYVKKLILYINPYPMKPGVYDDGVRTYYQDNSKHKEEFAQRRSYFFGPGFFSIRETIRNAWIANFQLIDNVRERLFGYVGCTQWLILIVGIPYLIFYALSIFVFGGIVTIICSLIHAIPILFVMLIIYVLFSITWVIDRIYLQIHSVKTSCPYDQVRVVIPMFECPQCGNKHARLVPGPYGIWHRNCSCGKRLPTTFLLGRSELKAFCPQCGHELAASDVQQFSLSVVGGTSSGKTVLLSAFYHEFFNRLDCNTRVHYEIPPMHAEMFQNLRDWFNGEVCDATALGQTADMYSVILKSDAFDVNKQFSLYDIAGEAFDDPAMTRVLPQKQMRDSNGLIIVIDPLSASAMRSAANREGDDTRNYSDADSAAVISNFVTYLKTVLSSAKIKDKSDKPVAVVITKSDLSSISRRISYHKIKVHMSSHPERYESFGAARDEMCREFLSDIGLYDAVRAIEASFIDVHYFPVSAIGHAANGEEYEPEHVVEPFYWLIAHTEPAIAELLGIDDIE